MFDINKCTDLELGQALDEWNTKLRQCEMNVLALRQEIQGRIKLSPKAEQPVEQPKE